MWIGLADLLLCMLSVVIVAVAPTKAKVDGVKPKAEFLITADWPVALNSDVDLWLVGPDKKPVFYGSRDAGCASLDRDSLGFRHLRSRSPTALRRSPNRTRRRRPSAASRRAIMTSASTSIPTANSPRARASIPVRVEITGLNPQVTTVFAKDVALDQVGQTINVASFDLILTARSSSPTRRSSRSPTPRSGPSREGR